MAYSVNEIRAALRATRGKIHLAAAALECHPKTVYNHMDRTPELRELVEDFRAQMVDKAERALEECIDEKEHWAIGFALKTLGRSRGYVERQEIEHHGEMDLKMYGRDAPLDDV